MVAAVAVVTAACGSSSKSSSPTTSGSSTGSSTGSATGSATGSSTGSSSGSNTASAPGVSKDSITIGFITSASGNAASTFSDSAKGAQARFAALNAAGGINGRKINMITADDQSSVSGDLTAAQDLVNKGVFAIVDYTPYAFGGYRYLQQKGIPVTGGAFDGPEWGIKPNTNMFSYGGGVDPKYPANTYQALFFKSLGVTSVAGFAYGVSPSSIASIKDLKFAVTSQGMQMPYENLSLPFGAVDFTSYAAGHEERQRRCGGLLVRADSNIAMAVAAKQAGIKLKAALMFSGADSSLFDSATATAAAQGTYWPTTIVPIDLNNAATNQFLANLKKYDPSYKGGYPSYGLTGSYLSADLMIKGLEVAGQNPTRESFINNLSKVTAWNAEGLLPSTDRVRPFRHRGVNALRLLHPGERQPVRHRQQRQALLRKLDPELQRL